MELCSTELQFRTKFAEKISVATTVRNWSSVLLILRKLGYVQIFF
jgi:hypothetical protein